MKQMFTFGLQVFTTLVLFMGIFVTYLERSYVLKHAAEKQEIINTEIGSKPNLAGILTSSVTTALTGVVSCGK
jgi:hypothetical protein